MNDIDQRGDDKGCDEGREKKVGVEGPKFLSVRTNDDGIPGKVKGHLQAQHL
jgi:hypothetical protein